MKCLTCGNEKPLDQFKRDKRRSSGHTAKCLECEREWHRRYYSATSEKRREQLKEYYQENKGRFSYATKVETYGKDVLRGTNAIRCRVYRGTITRPGRCEACGEPAHTHGHHSDYSRPLDVKWVCRACHAKIHTGRENEIIKREEGKR